jgi:hypothetical protein
MQWFEMPNCYALIVLQETELRSTNMPTVALMEIRQGTYLSAWLALLRMEVASLVSAVRAARPTTF